LEGRVIALFIADTPGAPMISQQEVHLVPGKGIEGDRFYGVRPAHEEIVYEVTLVEQEVLDAIWNRQQSPEPGGSARRNIVIQGCSLAALVGHHFRIGEVTLSGLARHDACYSQEITQADVCASLGGADLGAQILTEGTIAVGDLIQRIS
jgi:MOSC domain-containing protein YiiM